MYPLPVELSTAAEVIANRRAVRERLKRLPEWRPSPVVEAPVVVAVEPEPEPPSFERPPSMLNKRLRVRILEHTAAHYGVGPREIMARCRRPESLWPRQISMYLCVRGAGMSLSETARFFAGRDHTSVLAAVRRVDARVETDAMLAASIEMLSNMLGIAV